jgi:hypothetical protein
MRLYLVILARCLYDLTVPLGIAYCLGRVYILTMVPPPINHVQRASHNFLAREPQYQVIGQIGQVGRHRAKHGIFGWDARDTR